MKKYNARYAILTASLSLLFVATSVMAQTTLVSVNSADTNSGNGLVSAISEASADGRFVVFTDTAGDLVANDTNGLNDVFVRNLVTNKTTLASVNSAGTGSGNDDSYISSARTISADGNIVAFRSRASNLVANDTNGTVDVFARNLSTGTTTLVSVSANFGGGSGNNSSDGVGDSSLAVSRNGRYVAFDSSASDLVADDLLFYDTNNVQDVFVREYFGYLRRDPDGGGYEFWLAQVNKFPLRDVNIQQAMACSFITSAEYQTRFSPIVTHTNRECPQ